MQEKVKQRRAPAAVQPTHAWVHLRLTASLTLRFKVIFGKFHYNYVIKKSCLTEKTKKKGFIVFFPGVVGPTVAHGPLELSQ